MPAVIDTGGPRVLHCVERAVCPIISSPSTINSSASSFSHSAKRSHPVRQQRQSRSNVDAIADRCTESPADTLHRSTISETRFVPGNDERDKFFLDEGSSSVSATSSNDLGRLVPPNDRTRDRKRYDELRRDRVNRKNRRTVEIHRAREFASFPRKNENVPELNETVRECERLSLSNCQIDNDDERENDRPRTSTTNDLERKPDGSTTTSARYLNLLSHDHHSHLDETKSDVESSDNITMRLFGDRCVLTEKELICPRVVSRESRIRRNAQSAAISSQRVSNCVKYEWTRECECFSRLSRHESLGSTRTKSENERATRERRKSRHRTDILHKGRSYVQLAFLLFLVAFGHGSLSKSKLGTSGGKSASIGASFGVLTIGTIVDGVRAVPVDFDAGVRAERSANLSHITGASRKIQMYIKNRHLQILPDGTVNGSNDDTSEYTIFQRTSVSRGQLRIQGVATCLYLCMDSCGLLYGSRESTEDCVFNETLEQHNYNTYSSVRWSTPKKSLYLGLNRRGQPRRVQAKGHNLGRLSAYARVLTQVASPERVEALQARMLGAHHNLRHRHNSHHHRNIQNQQQQQQQTVCPNLPPQEKDGRDKFRCRKRKKRKKRKRQCKENEKPGPHCQFVEMIASRAGIDGKSSGTSETGAPQSKRSCEGAASEELCRKLALDAPAKKRKSRIEATKTNVGTRDKEQTRQSQKKKEMRGKKGTISERETGKIVDAIEGPKRKRPGIVKQKASSGGIRKKINGRISRTTIAADPTILPMSLPSSWFPGASTTPSMEISTWRRNGKTTEASGTANAMTSIEPKAIMRTGKSLVDGQLGVPESSTLETSTEGNFDERSNVSYFTNDSSLETSDETKSDESLQQDDDSTISTIECSTLMTTMDTTPPERTEDYTRATTQSIPASIEISRDRTGVIDDSTRLEETIKFDREIRPSLERLAM